MFSSCISFCLLLHNNGSSDCFLHCIRFYEYS
uniref:Uncharacterized protein n=1 Tax=Anguilla anguilla TaxID=7936 RepID=A0A0E9PKU7_ANGAN